MAINSKIRQLWAEKTFELTNIGAGALIFGQFLSDKGFQVLPTIIGFILVLVGYTASLILLSKK